MYKIFESMQNRVKKGVERERKFDRPLEKISRFLWPWKESKLIWFVCILAVLDYVSTFTALELSESDRVIEAGLMAGWALDTGGFLLLFVVDAIAIGVLVLAAVGIKALYRKWGHPGFGRAGFVLLLVPYAVIIMGIVINNVLVTFLSR